MRFIRLLVALTGLAGLAACSSASVDTGHHQLQDSNASPAPVVAAPPPPAPLPPQPPQAAPAIERPTQPIIVHFASNKAEISASTMQRLWDAAPGLKAAKPDEIRISGFTDARGAKTYNRALSERRARAVAEQLIKLGVTAPVIEIVGKGESRPTPSVPHPSQNDDRRVEITWGPVESAALGLTPPPSTGVDAAAVSHASTLSTMVDTGADSSVIARDPGLKLADRDRLSAAAGFGVDPARARLHREGHHHLGRLGFLHPTLGVAAGQVALVFPSHHTLPSALSNHEAGPARPQPTSSRIMAVNDGVMTVGVMTISGQAAPLTRSQSIQAPLPHRPADQPQGGKADRSSHPADLTVTPFA
ncbi:Outer membrane protein OmpA [Magnetospirillum fulvum]|uniref:Outer membrane protein OmpA n=1 Tax=Magnetospirillum fulvum TaxID=1082 RepID=A0A1H6GQX5_MAGFU|nr:Outer membrane protein OmpA [Magnetospirillum fulvum]